MRHFWLILLLFVSTGINAQQDDSNAGDHSTTKDVFEWFIKTHPNTNRDASESGYDQLTKETEPVSPQAATMQRFGEYPMDYSTGVPHISIPLYEIKLGNYTLPVSITYHASGIKVQDVASPVGLGWSLSAGGYIIRQEKSGVDKGLYLFKSENEIENAVDGPSFWFDMVRSKQYNTESDRYAYCFNGKNGVFRYAVLDSMKIKTIPYDPIIIEENGTGYKITDTDGIKYYFMAEEKNRGDFTYGGNRETMAWYLTKIEFADRNDSIVFKYAQDAYYYQQYISEYRHQGTQYSYSSNIWTATNASAIEDGSAIHTTECANMLLKEIVWRGNKVIFSYNNDRTDHVMMISNNILPRLTTMTVQNYSGNTVRTVTFDNAHYSGSTTLTYRMILEGLTISGSSVSAGTEDYTFNYNSLSLPNYYNATFTYPSAKDRNCHEDYWGYYNGTNTTYWTPDSCMPTGMTGANRSVNQTYAKAGILERITYPTGGYTYFSYESNQLDNGTLWGGLRLSNASSYDSGGSLLNQRTYQYSGSRVPVTTSLSTLYHYECPYWYYYHEWTDHWIHYSDQPLHTISLSNPYLSLTRDYGSPIYYQTVTEFYGTTSNNEGKTVYTYNVDSRASDYYSYEDEDASSSEPLRLYSMDYNVDNGNITPLLSKKEVYENNNGAYTLNHSEQYSYEDVSRPAFNVGVRFQSRLAYIDCGGSNPYPDYNDLEDVYSYHDVIAVPSFVRLASKTVRDYQAKVAITTTYDYDDSLRTLDPISEKVSSASGDYYRTDYSYPFNMNGSDYASMGSANMMVPVETRLYRNGTLTQTIRRDYTHQNGIFVNTSVSTAKGTGSLEQRIQYTYDSYGNLTFVLPPLASDALTATNTTWSITSNSALRKYAYNYLYDSRNRCIQKKLPGCEYISMTYDTADRLVTRQDGVQRNATIITYYEYDNFGRQTEMGTKNALNIKTPLLKYFYDNYTSLTATGLGINTSAGSDAAFPNNSSPNARGLLTGTWTALLNNTSTGYYTSYYYGKRERLVQSHAQNHLGGLNDTYYIYNYIGTTATRKQVHSATGQTTQTELYSYTYDYGDRLVNTAYKLNSNSTISLGVNTYDAVGRLGTHKPLNIETQTYGYNVRSWLTSITSTNFIEKLAYNTTVDGLTPEDAQYGGNIGAMQWKTGNETKTRNFQFAYTPLGWLEWADYYESGYPRAYDVYYYYDKMGNMTDFQRNGYIDDFYGIVDIPIFTYDGNRPTRIDDQDGSLTFPYNGGYHFIDYVQQNNEYAYDDNGNMTQDLNKRISLIQYNLLNLPQNITFSTGSTIAYTYDAEGRKLNVTYGSPSKTINYSGNMVYENGTLSQILTEGGYVTLSGTTPTYHTYLRDHQGNNRVVIDGSGTIEQVTQYYPFGYFFAETTNPSTQRYKYNDKEFDEMHGLHWYDYGARHYDPAIMRFTTIDPMCEKYYHLSPYAYCGNNPVNAVDPYGNDIWNLNPNGDIVKFEQTTEFDIINIVDSNNKTIDGGSFKFKYGTVNHQTIKHENGNYELFQIKGDSNGRNVFEALAQNTDVEWSLAQFDDTSAIPNLLTTSHNDDSDHGINNYLFHNKSYVMSLNRLDHNHPGLTTFPSFGINDKGNFTGDIGMVYHYNDYYPNNHIKYNIYALNNGKWGYYNYDENTIINNGKNNNLLQNKIIYGNKK